MEQKFIFTLFILLLLVPTLSAAALTEIDIKTIPHHEIQLVLFDANVMGFVQIERFVQNADRYGDATFNTTTTKTFNIAAYIKDLEHQSVVSETFSNSYSSGDEIYLEVAPSDFTLIATPEGDGAPIIEEPVIVPEETINETEEEPLAPLETTEDTSPPETDTEPLMAPEADTEKNNESKFSFLTNFVIFGEEGVISWTIIYIVGGIILLLIITLILIKLLKRNSRKGKEIIVKKWSDKQKEGKEEATSEKHEELKDLGEKLKELQNEIVELKKNKSPEEHHKELEKRIADKKKQVLKEEQELIKMREEMKG